MYSALITEPEISNHTRQIEPYKVYTDTFSLEEGPDGLEGGMSAKKYMTITGASKATTTRDLQDLVENHILIAIGGERNTRHWINL
jgi:Fic family protein